MAYFSNEARLELNAWIQSSAKKISRKVKSPSVQAVFGFEDGEIVAIAKMSALAEAGSRDRALLYSAGYRAVVDAVRMVATRNGHDFQDSLTDPEGATSEIVSGPDEAGETLKRLMLDELLDTLSPRHRGVVHALYFEDKTERVLAEEMGISHERIHQIKARALSLLRQAAESNPK